MDTATEQRVRAAFDGQPFMRLLGARLAEVGDGAATVEVAAGPELRQQHGFVHAGAVSATLDTACGFAALTVMEEGTGVLTAEFKINLLRPAKDDVLIAQAGVVSAGRTLVVCQARAWTAHATEPRPRSSARRDVAVMTATLVCVRGRADVVD